MCIVCYNDEAAWTRYCSHTSVSRAPCVGNWLMKSLGTWAKYWKQWRLWEFRDRWNWIHDRSHAHLLKCTWQQNSCQYDTCLHRKFMTGQKGRLWIMIIVLWLWSFQTSLRHFSLVCHLESEGSSLTNAQCGTRSTTDKVRAIKSLGLITRDR